MDMFDDAFGSAPATTAPQADPAADFLNREQADLGDLGMDFGQTPAAPAPVLGQEGDGTNSFFEPSTGDSTDFMGGLGGMAGSGVQDLSSSSMSDMPDIGIMNQTPETASTIPDISGSGMPDMSSMSTPISSGMPDMSSMSTPISSGMPDMTSMSAPIKTAMPDMSGMTTSPDMSSMSLSTSTSTTMPDLTGNGMADMPSSSMPDFSTENIGSEMPAIGAADPMEKGGPFESSRQNPRLSGEEPECLRKWREEQKERIRIKDEEEERGKEELRQKAKKELESFYKNYEEELQLTKKENRIAEEAFLADVNGLKPGTEWERVCRNSNFNSKVNHNKKDRSRMRSVLLQLKQTPLMNRE